MSRLVLTQITIKKEWSISSTDWYYLLQPANASAPDPVRDHYGNPPPTITIEGYSGWSTTEPTYTIGDERVLYEMSLIVYSDGTFDYSTPTISSSYEAAKDAYSTALNAQEDIDELHELGLHHGYIWDNSTYHAPTETIPVYPVGSYIASGINNTITRNNSNTYGMNTWISAGGINLRYNAIDLLKLTTSNLEFYYPSTTAQGTKAISLGTNGAINSLVFYKFNSTNKAMELTNSALNFYGSNTSTADAILTSTGLKLVKGGIIVGTAGSNNSVYISSDNLGSSVESLVPTSGGISKTDWRAIIGSKFAVDSEGNLYANNAHLSNAEVEGAITATSLTIGNGSNVYDGEAAINASGYTIEIIDDITAAYSGATIGENNTYLYPIMYLNGVKITSDITNTDYIWYLDGATTGGTRGHSSNGGVVAEYGHTYRVTYQFNDSAVGQAQPTLSITVDPSKYITRISDAGITVHPEDTSNNNFLRITADGVDIVKNNVVVANYGTTITIGQNNASRAVIDTNGLTVYKGADNVAEFGTTARIGKLGNSRFLVNSSSLQAYSGTDSSPYFEVSANGLSWGSNTAATTAQVIEAGNTADNYITEITESNGIRIHPANTENNAILISANGMEVFKGGTGTENSVAFYGDSTRIGKFNSSRVEISASTLKMISELGTTSFKTGAGTDEYSDYHTVNIQNINYQVTSGTSKTFILDLSSVETEQNFYVVAYVHAVGRYEVYTDVFHSHYNSVFTKGTSSSDSFTIEYPTNYNGFNFTKSNVGITFNYNATNNTLTVTSASDWPATATNIYERICVIDDVSIIKSMPTPITEIYGFLRLGLGNYYIGESTTAGNVETKVVTTNNNNFELVDGVEIYVTFDNAQQSNNTYLKIDNTEAKRAMTWMENNPTWAAGETVVFTYIASEEYFMVYPFDYTSFAADAKEHIILSLINLNWAEDVLELE